MPDTKLGESRNGGHARCENNARIFGNGLEITRPPILSFALVLSSLALSRAPRSTRVIHPGCPSGGSSFRHVSSRGQSVRYVPMSREGSNRKWKRGTDAVAHTPSLMSRSPINWSAPVRSSLTFDSCAVTFGRRNCHGEVSSVAAINGVIFYA